ncbi:MAG: uracil-DNA glycosylase [Candidatus Latescibacterota bacterium]|nr:uracil-DNA glycosylase [Candidatus Latescibacterota bacterium]
MTLESWKQKIPLMSADHLDQLTKRVDQLRHKQIIYPSRKNVFSAFELTPFQAVKIVLIGQDPYHSPNLAHGLAFSVPNGMKTPPTLRNIFQEVSNDLGHTSKPETDLTRWAIQGVLLLNSTLTVTHGEPGSHRNIGWQTLTDQVVKKLSKYHNNLVFLLWGQHAKSKADLIKDFDHLVLESAHPSPLSAYRGFIGCKHFSKANSYLKRYGKTCIQW